MKNKSLIEHIYFFILLLVLVGIALFIIQDNNNGETNKIVGIHIKGEVAAPGYYELEYGSRIKDAVLAAGRETKEADLQGINLAMNLRDGEEIIIPRKSDIDKGKDSDLININTADMYTLCKLDGIGETIAADIVNYRIKNGAFKTVSELKNVKGIGSLKFSEIKNKITVK